MDEQKIIRSLRASGITKLSKKDIEEIQKYLKKKETINRALGRC